MAFSLVVFSTDGLQHEHAAQSGHVVVIAFVS